MTVPYYADSRAIKDRRIYINTVLHCFDKAYKSLDIESVRRTLSRARSFGFKDGIVQMKAIHRHHNALALLLNKATCNFACNRRFAAAGRSRNADDQALIFFALIMNVIGKDIYMTCEGAQSCLLSDGFPQI